MQRPIFLPYIVETFGGLAKQAQEFHKLIANYGEQFSSAHSRRNLLSSISSDIARIVQEGNLRVVEKWLQQVSYNHHSNNTTIANDMYRGFPMWAYFHVVSIFSSSCCFICVFHQQRSNIKLLTKKILFPSFGKKINFFFILFDFKKLKFQKNATYYLGV